jgi:hypothetical protein
MQNGAAENRRVGEALKKDTRWARFRLLFVVALALIPAAAVLIARSDGESGAAAMELRVLSVKEHYPRALEVARKWRSDAILSRAAAYFRPSEGPKDLSISYDFYSAGPPAKFLLVWVDEEETGIVLESKEGELHPDQPLGDPVDPLQIPLDSPEALSIILQNGGARFLARHKNPFWPIGLGLEYRRTFYSEGPLVWAVSFADRVSLESETIRIDARTGEPVE